MFDNTAYLSKHGQGVSIAVLLTEGAADVNSLEALGKIVAHRISVGPSHSEADKLRRETFDDVHDAVGDDVRSELLSPSGDEAEDNADGTNRDDAT